MYKCNLKVALHKELTLEKCIQLKSIAPKRLQPILPLTANSFR